jgi:hypothetical protein
MKHIALVGYMGSGKTVIRELLQKQGYVHLSFATPLKEIVVKILGRSIDKQVDRPLLQRLGNGARNSENVSISDRSTNLEIRKTLLTTLLWPDGNKPDSASVEPFFNEEYDLTFGTSDYWVSRLLAQLGLFEGSLSTYFVVDDMRYGNEATRLRNVGFEIVRLEVPLEIVKQRLTFRDGGYKDEWFTHPSELEQLQIKEDLKIDNTKPINEVLNALNYYLEKN